MTEIEIKARVGDPDAAERNIASFASFAGETRKRDTYWAGGNPAIKVRVREEGETVTVTYKRKELRGDTEVNDEREFTISDRSAFETFIGDAGFAKASHKEKNTKRWVIREGNGGTEIGIELSLVESLGWFVELEALADDPGEEEIARIRRELFSALERCGIEKSAIETRYYTEMLATLQ